LESLTAVPLQEEEREIVVAFFFGHLRLDPREQLQMRVELAKVEPMLKDEIMTLDNPFVTWGIQTGEATLLVRQLKRRFGFAGQEREAAVRNLPVEKLEELGEAILGFDGIEQVDQWLGSAAAPSKE
jgi:hypothetical protein